MSLVLPILGNPQWGNLGNSLWQLASAIGLSKRYNCNLYIPPWKYSHYFKHIDAIQKSVNCNRVINEPSFNYCEGLLDGLDLRNEQSYIGISGWLQSWKYFEREDILKSFTFTDSLISSVCLKYGLGIGNKKTIGISIRLGDLIGNPNYVLLPMNYYFSALMSFPDWRECEILISSDSIEICKVHFACLPNVKFIQGEAIENLCALSLCDNLIIPNSTFGFWAAYLNKNQSNIIRPSYYFAGKLSRTCNTRDFWIPFWRNHDFVSDTGELKRIDLSDVTFTIPVHFDHTDRKENLDLSLAYLNKCFKTNIIVGEQGSDAFSYTGEQNTYVKFNYQNFHRTKMLNEMAKMSTTPIVINYDCDVLIPPLQILEAVEMIRNNRADFVFPYDGRFARVPRVHLKMLREYMDVGFFQNTVFNGMRDNDVRSVGGAVVVNKEKFFETGGENENYISYGNEDVERNHRWRLLEYRVERVYGSCYHVDHWIGQNSSLAHSNAKNNADVWNLIRHMDKAQLLEHIKYWGWSANKTASVS